MSQSIRPEYGLWIRQSRAATRWPHVKGNLACYGTSLVRSLICSMSVIWSAWRMTTIGRAAGRVPQSYSRQAQCRERNDLIAATARKPQLECQR